MKKLSPQESKKWRILDNIWREPDENPAQRVMFYQLRELRNYERVILEYNTLYWEYYSDSYLDIAMKKRRDKQLDEH